MQKIDLQKWFLGRFVNFNPSKVSGYMMKKQGAHEGHQGNPIPDMGSSISVLVLKYNKYNPPLVLEVVLKFFFV